ncbi:hypothetical protein ACPPVT_16235 [Angustibacter sp. McL0619]|uniref:hypothetical protein n=1 Tax=Angustibacter sp. McL0619 TaxID=3415676 RepID=UPI003CEAB13C
MTVTTSIASESDLTSTVTQRAAGDISTRLAGIGALTFAGVVFAQNVIRGATAPGNGASSAELIAHYGNDGAIPYVLAATYVLSGVGMALFLGGGLRLLLAGGRRAWAVTGFVGAVSIMALFAVVVGAEQALGVVAHQTQPDVGAVQAVSALHNSVFTVLDFSIAVALLGLARAGVAAGITPRVFRRLAPVGAALLLVGTLAGPSIAEGDAMSLFGLTGIGFLIWLSFLVATGARLVRSGTTAG